MLEALAFLHLSRFRINNLCGVFIFFLPFLHQQPSIICQQVVLRYFRSEMQNSSAMLTLRVFTIIYVRCNGFFFVFIVAAKCLFIYLDVTDYLKFLDIFLGAVQYFVFVFCHYFKFIVQGD